MEYLNIFRQDLRNLINKHRPIERLNNDNNDNNNKKNTDTNNNNNNNNNNNDNNDDTDRGEWKIMLRMYIRCTHTRNIK